MYNNNDTQIDISIEQAKLEILDYVVISLYFLCIFGIGYWVCWYAIDLMICNVTLYNSQQEEAKVMWLVTFLQAEICIGFQ